MKFIDTDQMNGFIQQATTREKAKIWIISVELIQWWGFYSIESLFEKVNKYIPEINKFANTKKMRIRAEKVRKSALSKQTTDLKTKLLETLPLEFGRDIEEVVPEITIIRDAFAAAFESVPSGTEKAEAWLYAYALQAYSDADIEALVYFKSKGETLIPPNELSDLWRKLLCNKAATSIVSKINNLDKSNISSLTISELASLYESNGFPMFLGARDEEEDYITASFFRAVQWFQLNEFEPWVNSYLQDVSTAYQGGISGTCSQFVLFYLCRSDLVINRASRLGLQAFLYGICIGNIESAKPWKIYWNDSDDEILNNKLVDYIPTASLLAFSWQRINPTSINNDVYKQAQLLLFQTQLPSGGWPLVSKSTDGDILSTCLAIHALATIRPSGYERYVEKAKHWLLNQQNEVGCWHIQGAPAIMLNILCLEAISLVDGNCQLTYEVIHHNDASTSSLKRDDSFVVLCEGSLCGTKNRNFDENCYTRIFCPEFPNATFCSVGSCNEIVTDDNVLLRSIKKVNPYHKIIRLIDRDDRSAEEVLELQQRGVTVLSLRELESYLLDDEIINILCKICGKTELVSQVLKAKQSALENSVARGNPLDDLKSASGEFFTQAKKMLGLIQCGNDTVSFLRDTMAPLVTKETKIYKHLRRDVFGF